MGPDRGRQRLAPLARADRGRLRYRGQCQPPVVDLGQRAGVKPPRRLPIPSRRHIHAQSLLLRPNRVDPVPIERQGRNRPLRDLRQRAARKGQARGPAATGSPTHNPAARPVPEAAWPWPRSTAMSDRHAAGPPSRCHRNASAPAADRPCRSPDRRSAGVARHPAPSRRPKRPWSRRHRPPRHRAHGQAHRAVRSHAALARPGHRPPILGKVVGMDADGPVRPHPPGVVDRDDLVERCKVP